MPPTTVVIGDALIDQIHTGSGTTEHVGGAGLNVAVGLARLGVSVTLIATIGQDRDGETIRAFLQKHGVSFLPTLSDIGTSRALSQRIDGEPSYTFNAAARRREVVLGDAEARALAEASAIVVSSFPFDNDAQVRQLQNHVAAPRHRLIVDPNPRPGLLRDAKLFEANFRRLAACSLLTKISDEDAQLLGGWALPDLTSALIRAGAQQVLATAGRGGATIATSHGLALHQPIADLPGDIVDTMGAGDATLAATVRGLLLDGGVTDSSLFWSDLLGIAMTTAAATCRTQGALLQVPAGAWP